MEIELNFVGAAERHLQQYEAIGATDWLAHWQGQPLHALPAVPNVGDDVVLRLHPGPDLIRLRCTGRLFDFSAAGQSVLYVDLDLAPLPAVHRPGT